MKRNISKIVQLGIAALFTIGMLMLPLYVYAQERELTPEQAQVCKENFEAANNKDYSRPIALPVPIGPGKFLVGPLPDHFMVRPEMSDNKFDVIITEEVILECGEIMQYEDFDGDGEPDRKVLWLPVGDTPDSIHWMPSTWPAASIHPEDELNQPKQEVVPPKPKGEEILA